MEKKFTALEWATMEGGHDIVDPVGADFSFLKDLHEARMTRNSSNHRKLTYTDCCERVYLILLVLEAMRRDSYSKSFVRGYSKQTTQHDLYKIFRVGATDLYNFIYFVDGDERAMDKLKDPQAARRLRSQITIPVLSINRYLLKISTGQTPTGISELFIKLESALKITNPDYKAIRRTLVNFDRVDKQSIKTSITKLLFAVRAKLRNSDIIDNFENFASENNLEKYKVKDTEPTISSPDITFDNTDLIYFAKLVGQQNLYKAIKYVELASQGKTIPSNIAQGMNPAIQLLVDIVQAGPSYIGMLKYVHKQAKNKK